MMRGSVGTDTRGDDSTSVTGDGRAIGRATMNTVKNTSERRA
jgi:hypothetical protein